MNGRIQELLRDIRTDLAVVKRLTTTLKSSENFNRTLDAQALTIVEKSDKVEQNLAELEKELRADTKTFDDSNLTTDERIKKENEAKNKNLGKIETPKEKEERLKRERETGGPTTGAIGAGTRTAELNEENKKILDDMEKNKNR